MRGEGAREGVMVMGQRWSVAQRVLLLLGAGAFGFGEHGGWGLLAGEGEKPPGLRATVSLPKEGRGSDGEEKKGGRGESKASEGRAEEGGDGRGKLASGVLASGASSVPLNSIKLPVLMGDPTRGLGVPETQEGKLRAFHSIQLATRLGEHTVLLEGACLEFYAEEDGSLKYAIDLPRAEFDEAERRVVSKDSVAIRTREFEVKGAGLEFNMRNKEAVVKGPGRMSFYGKTRDAADSSK